MNINTSHLKILLLILVVWCVGSDAFSQQASTLNASPRDREWPTKLSAWSLPVSASATFTFKSTWYNEYDPTARRTVYDDAPMEYKFATFDDWSATPTKMIASEDSLPKSSRLRNPIRWLARRVRRGA